MSCSYLQVNKKNRRKKYSTDRTLKIKHRMIQFRPATTECNATSGSLGETVPRPRSWRTCRGRGNRHLPRLSCCGGIRRTLALGMPNITTQSISSGKNFRASNPAEKGSLHAVESSRAFWNVRAAVAGDESPRQVSRLCICHALSHGCLHVCDAFRENRPRDAQRAYGVLMRHCVRRSFPRRTVRSGPFACAHCGLCPRDELGHMGARRQCCKACPLWG